MLLRLSVGFGAIFGGVSMLVSAGGRSIFPMIAGWTGAAAGVALVLGVLTPAAGILQAALSLCGLVTDLANSGIHLSRQLFMGLEPMLLSIAIFLLGPGAFSLDAVFFGRREIVIPAARHRAPDEE